MNFLHLPHLTIITEKNLDELDIENHLDKIVREMDYKKMTEIKKESIIIILYKIGKNGKVSNVVCKNIFNGNPFCI